MVPKTKTAGLQIYAMVAKERCVLERRKETACTYFSKKSTHAGSGK